MAQRKALILFKLNSHAKMAPDTVFEKGSRLPEPCPPQAGCWCSRRERRPYVRLTVLGNEPRHASGLRPRIPDNQPLESYHPETTHLTATCSCEACSAFTRVAARTLARSPICDLLHRRLQHFVTSMTAPVASGWSGRRVGLAPTGKRRLVTAHTLSGRCRPRPRTSRLCTKLPFAAVGLPVSTPSRHRLNGCNHIKVATIVSADDRRSLLPAIELRTSASSSSR
jgi:hypothetical protein